MRALLAVAFVAVLALLTVHAASQPKLTPEPMRIEQVKDNLYVSEVHSTPARPTDAAPTRSTMGCFTRLAMWRCGSRRKA